MSRDGGESIGKKKRGIGDKLSRDAEGGTLQKGG